MANTTIGFGTALVLLGLVGFVATGAHSPTALIPAAIGILFLGLGWLARNPRLRMHAMHGAALLAVIGFVGSVRGLGQLVRMLGGTPIARPAAAIAQSIMAVTCLAFVVLAVRSFIVARRERPKA